MPRLPDSCPFPATALLFFLLLAATRGAQAQAPDGPAGPPGADSLCSVTLYGDSILHGGYAISRRLDEPPAVALRRLRPRYRVVDRSANSETANARLPQFLGEPRSTRFVVLGHGLNDAAQRLPLAPVLTRMVRTVRAEGRVPILTGLSRQEIPIPLRASYDGVARQVALDTDTAFADWGAAPVRTGEMADPIHPGARYSQRLTQRIVAVLDWLAPECAWPLGPRGAARPDGAKKKGRSRGPSMV